jgi:hypothetical protein
MKFTSLAVAALCFAARAEAFTGPQVARHARFGAVSTVRHDLRFKPVSRMRFVLRVSLNGSG